MWYRWILQITASSNHFIHFNLKFRNFFTFLQHRQGTWALTGFSSIALSLICNLQPVTFSWVPQQWPQLHVCKFMTTELGGSEQLLLWNTVSYTFCSNLLKLLNSWDPAGRFRALFYCLYYTLCRWCGSAGRDRKWPSDKLLKITLYIQIFRFHLRWSSHLWNMNEDPVELCW